MIAESNAVLNLLYNKPSLLEKAFKTGMLRDMDVIFMDDKLGMRDFTIVKKLYEKHGSPYILEILSSLPIEDSQIPSNYDRGTQKYCAVEQTATMGMESLSNDICDDNFIAEMREYIGYVRHEKLKDTSYQMRDMLLDDVGVDIVAINRRRDLIMGKLKQGEAVREWSELVDECEAYGNPMRIITGIDAIDEKVVMYEGNILTIAATPAAGKTSMLNQMIVNWMLRGDHSCLYFSLENDAKVTKRNMTAYMTSMPEFKNESYKVVNDAMKKFKLYYCSNLFDIEDMMTQIRSKLAEDPSLKYVAIDYIQLVRDKSVSSGDYYMVLTRTMEALKELKNSNLFIVILSQIDKASAREKSPPDMHSTKGSGAVTELCSYALFNYKAGENTIGGMDPIRCFVRKARDSRACEMKLMFNGKQRRFYTVNEDGTIYKKEESE